MAFKKFKKQIKDENNEKLPKDVIRNGCVCDFFVFDVKELESKDVKNEDGTPMKVYLLKSIVNGFNDDGEKVMSFANFWSNDWMSISENDENHEKFTSEMARLARSVGFGEHEKDPYDFVLETEEEYKQFLTGKDLNGKWLKGKVKVRYWMEKDPLTGKYDKIVYQDQFDEYRDLYKNGDTSPKINYDLVEFSRKTDFEKGEGVDKKVKESPAPPKPANPTIPPPPPSFAK